MSETLDCLLTERDGVTGLETDVAESISEYRRLYEGVAAEEDVEAVNAGVVRPVTLLPPE